MYIRMKLKEGAYVSEVFSCSAQLVIPVPQLDWWFMYSILYITRLGLSFDLIFDMKVVFVTLYMENPISGSPFHVKIARLYIFKISSVFHLELGAG